MKTYTLFFAAVLAVFTPDCFRAYAADDARLFPEIEKEATSLNEFSAQVIADLKKLGVPTRDEIEQRFPLGRFRDFAGTVRLEATAKLGGQGFPRLEEQLSGFELSLSQNEKLPTPLPVFTAVEKIGDTKVTYFFTDRRNLLASIAEGDSQITVTTEAGPVTLTRSQALAQLSAAISPYRRALASEGAAQVRDHALQVSKDWDDYFEKGRQQTFLDIMLTTVLMRSYLNKPELVGPPPCQFFVLHPNAVIENINAAPDGDQLGGAVAIEWFGVNWWRGIGKFKVPLGISVCSLYSDRPGVDDIGHGLMVYVANKYCLGWADHGGHSGFFVTLDLLKLFDDKKATLESYKARINTLRNSH